MKKVEVHSYNERWPLLFLEEANELKRIFRDEIIDIHHIGSTSIPGLKAKPIIDIMPVVRDIYLVDNYNKEMQDIGYEPMGEFGIAGRRYFRKGGDERTHHVHVFQIGSAHITRHLAFRNYLREHPSDAKKYGDLKENLAAEFPFDRESYINGKDSLVKEIEAKALSWYKEN